MFYLVLLEICCFYDFQIECMQIRLVKFVTQLFNELRQNCHLANKISILVYVQFIIIQFWWRLKKVEILTITGKISVCVLCYWSFKVLSLVAFMLFFLSVLDPFLAHLSHVKSDDGLGFFNLLFCTTTGWFSWPCLTC